MLVWYCGNSYNEWVETCYLLSLMGQIWNKLVKKETGQWSPKCMLNLSHLMNHCLQKLGYYWHYISCNHNKTNYLNIKTIKDCRKIVQ